MKNSIFTICCLFSVLTACQSKMATPVISAQTKTNTNTITGTTTGLLNLSTQSALTKIEWDTSGGGNLHYTLTPNPDPDHTGEYLIQLSALRFETHQDQIVVSVNDVHLHNRLDALFGGRLPITEQAVDSNSMTGSFSQVTLYNSIGVMAIYKRPVISKKGAENLFEDIRAFIEANLDPENNPKPKPDSNCIKLATLEGIWHSTETEGSLTTKVISTIHKTASTDGTEQFDGTDQKIAAGCFNTTTSTQDVHYVFDRASCVITQQVNQTVQTFKILSVGHKAKKSAFKMALCNDSSCAQVSSQTLILTRDEY